MKFFGPHRPERVLLRRNTLYESHSLPQEVRVWRKCHLRELPGEELSQYVHCRPLPATEDHRLTVVPQCARETHLS